MKLFCTNEEEINNSNSAKKIKMLGALLLITLSIFFFHCVISKPALGVWSGNNLAGLAVPSIKEHDKDIISKLRDIYLDKIDSMTIKKYKMLRLLENEQVNNLDLTEFLESLIESLEEGTNDTAFSQVASQGNLDEDFFDV